MLHGHGSGWWRVFMCPDTESPSTAAGQKVLQRERMARLWTAFRDSFSGSTLALSLRAGRQTKTCSLVGTAIPAPKCLLSLKCRKGAGKMVWWSPCFAGMWIQVSVFGTHAQLSVVIGMCEHSTPWEIGRGNSKARELGVYSGERWRRDLSQKRRQHPGLYSHLNIHRMWHTSPCSHTWTCLHSCTYIPRHACTTYTHKHSMVHTPILTHMNMPSLIHLSEHTHTYIHA